MREVAVNKNVQLHLDYTVINICLLLIYCKNNVLPRQLRPSLLSLFCHKYSFAVNMHTSTSLAVCQISPFAFVSHRPKFCSS